MIIGHQKQWQFLKNSYKLGKLSHAYLFYGPSCLGKKKLAIEFVKFLNCENTSANKPCDICRACIDIEKGIYPDFFLVEPEEKEIKIAQLRKLEYYFSLRPSVGSFKTAIIDQAHSMTWEAQSCFLKTLEEPKGKAVFILITEHPDMLLPTILSRVQRIKFFPVKKTEIVNYLKKQNISDEKIKEITNFCSGKPGLAINFLREPQKLENIKQKISQFDKLARADLYQRFQYAQELSKQPQDLKEILDIWIRHTRKTLIEKSQTPGYSLTKLKNIIEKISQIQFLLSATNVNPRLALEILMLEL